MKVKSHQPTQSKSASVSGSQGTSKSSAGNTGTAAISQGWLPKQRSPKDITNAWDAANYFANDSHQADTAKVPAKVAQAFERIAGSETDVSSLWGPLNVKGHGETYAIWKDDGMKGNPALTIVNSHGKTVASGWNPTPDEDGTYGNVVWN